MTLQYVITFLLSWHILTYAGKLIAAWHADMADIEGTLLDVLARFFWRVFMVFISAYALWTYWHITVVAHV